MREEIHEKLKAIKQSFRLRMNGDVSRSMRGKGLDYKINWGLSVMDLKQMAAQYGKDYELAVELWKENIRECKILATMIMPPEQMQPDLVDLWMEQTPNAEIAEQAAFNLFQHLGYAPVLAFTWIAAADDVRQVCGYQLLSRLFMKRQYPNDRGISEFLDQALAALQDPSLTVRHAALNCVQRFASLGEEYEIVAQKAMKSIHLELF